jgi:hypothetical protein
MNSSLHVSSHWYASQQQVMEQIQTETQNGNFMKEYVSLMIDPAFAHHLHCGCRKDSYKQPAVHPIMPLPQRS